MCNLQAGLQAEHRSHLLRADVPWFEGLLGFTAIDVRIRERDSTRAREREREIEGERARERERSRQMEASVCRRYALSRCDLTEIENCASCRAQKDLWACTFGDSEIFQLLCFWWSDKICINYDDLLDGSSKLSLRPRALGSIRPGRDRPQL